MNSTHDLVTSNIYRILGQNEEKARRSNQVQVNALAKIGLEQIKDDYLATTHKKS